MAPIELMWGDDHRAGYVQAYASISASALLPDDAERGPEAAARQGAADSSVAPRRLRRAAGMTAAFGLLAVLLILSVSGRGDPVGPKPTAGASEQGSQGLWSVPWLEVSALQDTACSTAERLLGQSLCATTSTTTTTTETTVTSTTTTSTHTTSTKTTTSSTTRTTWTRTTSTSTTRTRTSTTSTTTTVTLRPLWPHPAKELGSGTKKIVKGISYAPVPLTQPGAMLPDDDFMSEDSATLWGPPSSQAKGRRDFAVMKALGANAVRLYGNDPALDHSAFLDEAKHTGLEVVVGLSDYPFVQMRGNCIQTGFDCYEQIKEQYTQNLKKGFISASSSYHEALATVIIMNEPDLKFEGGLRGTPGPAEHFGKALISALDGIISAEQEANISGRAPNLTVAFSFGRCEVCSEMGHLPGIGQMLELRRFVKDPSLVNYTAKNDLWYVYQRRFINSFNTANPAIDIRPLFLDAYDQMFPQTPVFIGEYHSPNFADQRTDLARIMQIAANESTMLNGLSFFEFQKRYDKGGGEMAFGMFGLGEEAIAPTTIATRTYSALCLEPVELKSQPAAAAGPANPQQCGHGHEDEDFVIEGGWGQALDHIPTPGECCARCQGEQRCEVWTWIKDAGLDGVPSQCWLKGGAPATKTRKLGVISSNMKADSTATPKPTEAPKVSYVHTVLAEAFGGPGLLPEQMCPGAAADAVAHHASTSGGDEHAHKVVNGSSHDAAASSRLRGSAKSEASSPRKPALETTSAKPTLGWSQIGQL